MCIVSKRSDLDVGMPFILHLGKEQKIVDCRAEFCLTGSGGIE